MRKLTIKDLIMKDVRHVEVNGSVYFNSKDVKVKFPDMKFNVRNMVDIKLGGEIIKLVKVEDIEPMTDFDKNMKRFMNFRGE